MSLIKSFSVGNGDMFYIKHDTDNFTVIDCYLTDDIKNTVLDEIINASSDKEIKRFISTHPDEDHIKGLKYLNDNWNIYNFYCVYNEATKEDETIDFKEYCKLRDSDKAFHIFKNCSRKWMNQESAERRSSGINILWPDIKNPHYIEQLQKVKEGESPNNISPIIKYSLNGGVTALWMGDLESDFLELIKENVNFCNIDILFAPHHGRDSGKISEDLLSKINPKIIIIGEALSENLNYYSNYNTITQNTAGDIVFDCENGEVDIYISSDIYKVNYLEDKDKKSSNHGYYLGTLEL